MSTERSPRNRRLSRRELLRRGAIATAVTGLGLSGLAGNAAAGGDSTNGVPSDAVPIDGPTTITEPGYYVLTKDIVVNDAREVIVVEEGVSDVTIDGQGHTIRGPGKTVDQSTGIRVGLYLSDEVLDATVKNVIITGFQTGIEYSDTRNGTLTNAKVTHCEAALRLYTNTDLTIADNVIAKNDIVFFQDEGASGTHILRNRITRNEVVSGFEFSSRLLVEGNRFDYNNGPFNMFFTSDSEVIDNLFYQNESGLRYFSSIGTAFDSQGDVARGNRFIENDRYGIVIEEDSTGVLIGENDVFRNGTDGIRLARRTRECTISKNRIIGNGEDGVHLLYANENHIAGNLIRQNGGDGIELRSVDVQGSESIGSNDNVVRENIVRENGDEPIKVDENSTGNVVEDNQIDDDAPNVCSLPEE